MAQASPVEVRGRSSWTCRCRSSTGWLRRGSCAPIRGWRASDHRADGQRDEGGPRRLPRRRHERSRHQAHRAQALRRRVAAVAARAIRHQPSDDSAGAGSTSTVASSGGNDVRLAQTNGAALEGLDIDGTLTRLGIDRPSLERMLVRFAEGQRPTLDALRAGRRCRRQRRGRPSRARDRWCGRQPRCRSLTRSREGARTGGRDRGIPISAARSLSSRSARPRCSARSKRSALAMRSRRLPSRRTGRSTARMAGAALERLAEALDGFDLSSAGGALADLGLGRAAGVGRRRPAPAAPVGRRLRIRRGAWHRVAVARARS